MDPKELLTRTPPSILYHYTTQRGLLGILDSKEIWATHTQYLNDEREFRHAIDLTKDEIGTMLPESDATDHELLERTATVLDGSIESINVCVSSFSEAGDSLSQWRAYGDAASSFAIGFSGGFLRSVADERGFWLGPVIYQESAQRALVRELLKGFVAEKVPDPPRLRAYFIAGLLNRYAPFLKHESFAEEREWRIVSRPLSCTDDRFAYRTGSSMLVPYFRIPLTSPTRQLAIEELFIGPTPHAAQSEHSVTTLFMKHRLNTRVRRSAVPYRNW